MLKGDWTVVFEHLNPRGRDYLGVSIRFTTGFLLAIPLKSDYCRKITWITLKLIIKRNPPLHMLMLFELKDRDKRLKENDSMTSIGLSIGVWLLSVLILNNSDTTNTVHKVGMYNWSFKKWKRRICMLQQGKLHFKLSIFSVISEIVLVIYSSCLSRTTKYLARIFLISECILLKIVCTTHLFVLWELRSNPKHYSSKREISIQNEKKKSLNSCIFFSISFIVIREKFCFFFYQLITVH